MTQLVRTVALATAFAALATTQAMAQRGRSGGALPRLTTARPAPPSHASGGQVRTGDLPRIVNEGSRRSGYPGSPGFGRSAGGVASTTFGDRGSRFARAPHTRRGVGAGCVFGCFRSGSSITMHAGRFPKSFFIGHHFGGFPFAVPVLIPYPIVYDGYAEPPADSYRGEPERAASKLIVVGAGTGGAGDALAIETVADSVRLTWLGAGRPAREVKLFVTDSTQRQLATRSASPTAPTATFEVSTLSAPVSFAGVTVVFDDGVTSTTVVPYRSGGGVPR